MTVDEILARIDDEPRYGAHAPDCRCSPCNLARVDKIADDLTAEAEAEAIRDRSWYSTRQRLIVATFPSPEHARMFDQFGDPTGLVDYGADLAIVAEP